jgi:hypothetical protein
MPTNTSVSEKSAYKLKIPRQQSHSPCLNSLHQISLINIAATTPYLSLVPLTTSSSIVHPSPDFPSGPVSNPLRNPDLTSQSLTNCLSKLGCGPPGSYNARGQYRDESGVRTSSISINDCSDCSAGTSPNSNFVSARIRPRVKAYAAASLYNRRAVVEIRV